MNKPPPPDKKAVVGGCLVMIGIVVLLALTLSFCVASPDVPDEAPSPVAAPVMDLDFSATQEQIAELERLRDPATRRRLWRGLPDVPLGNCMARPEDRNGLCVISQTAFVESYWPEAWAGDYQARRNVAFCFSTSCDGAVIYSPLQACAWRKVIVGSGDPLVDGIDAVNHDQDCRDLTPTELNAALAQADGILGRR